MSKIVMLNSLNRTFLKRDYEILKSKFEVDLISGHSYIDYFRQWRRAKGYAVYFSWWGTSLHTVLFAKLFGGKSVIVAGGHEVAYVPEIPYGVFATTTLKKHIVRFVLQTADVVLPVSEVTRRGVLQHATPKRLKVIHNGVDTAKCRPEGRKENIVLTVGTISQTTTKVKGLETFVRSAEYLPDTQFVLIGQHKDKDSLEHLRTISPSNVRIHNSKPFEELLGYFRRAKVYVQVSLHESFGVALTEAMACECVPVVTRKAELPEVVGDTGYYVPYNDPKATAEAIAEALGSPNKGRKARNRVKERFTLQKRKENLLEAINALVKNHQTTKRYVGGK